MSLIPLTQSTRRRLIGVCGRYARTQGADEIFTAFDLASNEVDNALPLNWNIAPTNEIFIIRGEMTLTTASWGLIAPWSADSTAARASQSHAINARSESIHEKPTFRDAFRRTRCIIPVNGYYEWATALGKYSPKQPFYMSPDQDVWGAAFSVAGIWSSWRSPTGQQVDSASIITREAVGELATIHSRMPVILPRESWKSWLDQEERDISYLQTLMNVEQPDHGILIHPVSSRVNLVANNGPDLIAPIELGEPTTLF
jgi:putative SOS response-associated peptidase YedK